MAFANEQLQEIEKAAAKFMSSKRPWEEIIKELIEERNELDKIIKEYDELLGMQKISEKDINYIHI